MAKGKNGKVTTTRVIQLEFDKETPGALRYKEIAKEGAKVDDMLIGQLYLRKAQVEGSPKAIEVSVTFK
jgi:hypothetical protein